MDTFFKKLIESGVIIAITSSLFMIIGFISKFANNRVLGIQTANYNTTSYMEQAGNFFLQSSQILFKPIWYTEYLTLNFLLIFLLIFTSIILVFFKYVKPLKIVWLYKSLISIFIVLNFLMISNLFSSITTIKSVLQPQSIKAIESFDKAIDFNVTYQKKPHQYNKNIIETYERGHNNEGISRLFSLYTEKNELKRKETYLTILLLSIVTLVILVIILNLYREYIQKIHKVLLTFLFSYFAFFLSYTHGVLGVSFRYPLVDLEYKIDDRVHKIDNVILLENNIKVLTLNRLNYMKIIEIPYSHIVDLKQKSTVELFQNCSSNEREVKLCEEFFY